MASVLGYVPGTSEVHKMHPLTKLIWLMGALVLSMTLGPVGLGIGVVGVALVASYCRVWRASLGYYRFLIFFAILVVVLSVLFTREGTLLWPNLPSQLTWLFGWTDVGIWSGITTSLRMLLVAGVFPIFLGTTQPRDIVTTLVEKLRVPYDYAFMFTSALRFIPALTDEIAAISQAQAARGFSVEGRGLVAKVKAYAPIAVPLVLSSLSRAERMAIALETRGYGSGPRTYFYNAAFSRRDLFALVGLGLSIALSILL